jgi:UDP-glucose:(heptosyl)LPS alpha-1,3-glucosyltransferase
VDSAKLRRIYNGIDLQLFCPLAHAHERSAQRRQLGLPEAPLLLFVGSGFERKGLAQLISAMSMRKSDWQLAVLGRDKHEAHYRKQVARLGQEEKVHFIGVAENVVPYYQCADLLVHPCLYDPFSNVVLEAMACGLGVITNQYNGANEVISSQINGLSYDGDDVNTLCQALEKAHDCFDDYRETARATAEGYSITKMVDEIVSLYCELLSIET